MTSSSAASRETEWASENGVRIDPQGYVLTRPDPLLCPSPDAAPSPRKSRKPACP
jgi:hypothetical protein